MNHAYRRIILFLIAALACGPRYGPITHGVAVGDVTPTSAVVWARSDAAGVMYVSATPLGEEPGSDPLVSTRVDAGGDFTGRVHLRDLAPYENYRYSVWFDTGLFSAWRNAPAPEDGDDAVRAAGAFLTAAPADFPAPVRFAFGGDIAGQNVCRDRERGFPVFRVLRERSADVPATQSKKSFGYDFFIGLGDMIYADNRCEAVGLYGNAQIASDKQPAATLTEFRPHWQYLRADPDVRRFFAGTPAWMMWDDHEVVNDFGPAEDTGSPPEYSGTQRLMPAGRAAFLEWNPILQNADEPERIYRKLRFGKHLEIFLLDNRQYRDPRRAADTGKSMLGPAQLQWLLDGLAKSDVTHRIIATSVPLSIPTGTNAETTGRDGWANYEEDTGYESELGKILSALAEQGGRPPLWITADVHFASVFEYTPFPERPAFRFHEVVTGPMHAGIFPNREFDATMRPRRLFFHGPQAADAVRDFDEALGWFNFGEIEIDGAGVMTVRIVNAHGQIIHIFQQKP